MAMVRCELLLRIAFIAIDPCTGHLLIVAFDRRAKIVTSDYTPTLFEGAANLLIRADCTMF